MSDRFSADGRQVLVFAQEEARFLGHQVCGAEHLLLGLSRDPSSAQTLAVGGYDLDRVREAVALVCGRAEPNLAGIGDPPLPFDASAKGAIDQAITQAGAPSPVGAGELLAAVLGSSSPNLMRVRQILEQDPASTLADRLAQIERRLTDIEQHLQLRR